MEYRFQNESGVFEYFMDDKLKAIILSRKGKEIQCRRADPFISNLWNKFDPDNGYRNRRSRALNRSKYSYKDYIKFKKLQEQGCNTFQISKITGIHAWTLDQILVGTRPTYRRYAKKYEKEKKHGRSI